MRYKYFFVFILIFNPLAVFAKDLTPREIMQKAVDQFKPDTEVQEIEMTLIDKIIQKRRLL